MNTSAGVTSGGDAIQNGLAAQVGLHEASGQEDYRRFLQDVLEKTSQTGTYRRCLRSWRNEHKLS